MTQMAQFRRLLRLAPPPRSPVDAGSPDGWEEIERILVLSLPGDYKQYVNTYGSGEFGGFLVPLNAFARVEGMNLVRQVDPFLDIYRDGLKSSLSEQCPFPTYPDRGGLLPLARDLNGGDMFWLTEGKPDNWTLVHYDWRGGYLYQRQGMGLVTFFVRWLSGELPESFFGHGNSPNIKRHPVFCPSGQKRESGKGVGVP